MRNRGNEPPRRIPRQLSIRVQGDDVSDTREDRKIADLHGKPVVAAAEKIVEIKQLAALSLPTHPFVFHFVEHAVPVQMEKGRDAVLCILAVEILNQARAQRNMLVTL